MLRKLCGLKSSRGQIGPFLVAALAPFFLSNTAHAGSIRYELPDLIGQHLYGSELISPGERLAHVDTPFGFNAIDRARLVVVGTVTVGRARGDGILREATEFDLLPSVRVIPSFARSILVPTEVTIGSFRLEDVYPFPFVPETTPLPNPDGYPPVSFDVAFGAWPSFSTNYPPLIDPGVGLPFGENGITFDVPIVANVTEAYIILEGAQVPEPATWMLVLAGAAIVGTTSRRFRSVVADSFTCAGGRR